MILPGIEVWRGSVNTWECDAMGHMNVRFYIARAMEGLVGLAGAVGLGGAFRANSPATLMVKDHHVRFMREAGPRAPLHMLAGVLSIDSCEARILQLLIHSGSGEVAASIQTRLAHVTSRDERPFPWAERTLTLAGGLKVDTPQPAAPRSLDLSPSAGSATLEQANRLGLNTIAAGAIGHTDCDVFGRMRAETVIGRISEGVPALANVLGPTEDPQGQVGAAVGGAVLEYRLAYHAWPRAGDRFIIKTGLTAVTERTRTMVHWMLDPETGKPWSSACAVAVALDLQGRKIVPLAARDISRLQGLVTPNLLF